MAYYQVFGVICSFVVAWLTSINSLHPDLYWSILGSPQINMERVWSIYALPDWPDLQSGRKAWEVEYDDTWEKVIYANEFNRFGLSRLTCSVKESAMVTIG